MQHVGESIQVPSPWGDASPGAPSPAHASEFAVNDLSNGKVERGEAPPPASPWRSAACRGIAIESRYQQSSGTVKT